MTKPKTEVLRGWVDDDASVGSEPEVVNFIRITDGYDPNAPVEEPPRCQTFDGENFEQCGYYIQHDGPHSFDEESQEPDVYFFILKTRAAQGDLELIDGSDFMGLTAEIEEDD